MPGATGTLASFFVEIASKGVEQTNKEIAGLGVGRAKDEAATQSLAKAFAATLPIAGAHVGTITKNIGHLGDSVSKLGQTFSRMGSIAGGIFGGLTNSVMGLVHAGLAGTIEGERLNWHGPSLAASWPCWCRGSTSS